MSRIKFRPIGPQDEALLMLVEKQLNLLLPKLAGDVKAVCLATRAVESLKDTAEVTALRVLGCLLTLGYTEAEAMKEIQQCRKSAESP